MHKFSNILFPIQLLASSADGYDRHIHLSFHLFFFFFFLLIKLNTFTSRRFGINGPCRHKYLYLEMCYTFLVTQCAKSPAYDALFISKRVNVEIHILDLFQCLHLLKTTYYYYPHDPYLDDQYQAAWLYTPCKRREDRPWECSKLVRRTFCKNKVTHLLKVECLNCLLQK